MDWPHEETKVLEWIEGWIAEIKATEARREAGKAKAAEHFNVAPPPSQKGR